MELKEFKEKIISLSERIEAIKDSIQTEEGTKSAMIMPLLAIWGYNVFDPREITPEYTCDFGIKKGERIDYALFKDGFPLILIECKHWKMNLDKHSGQLFRYFQVSKAKYGLLTNGIEYRFFTDIDTPNLMDNTPFFIFRIDQPTEAAMEELSQFHKECFDPETAAAWACRLKNVNAVKDVLNREFNSPSENFVRCIARQVTDSTLTAKVCEEYSNLIKRSVLQIVNDRINARLSRLMGDSDLANGDSQSDAAAPADPDDSEKSLIETTALEMEAFYVVRSILRPSVSAKRIAHRDTISYFGILLDDNNRKPICRLYLNRAKKYVGTFDANKKETKHAIESLDDLYKYEADFIKSIQGYDNGPEIAATEPGPESDVIPEQATDGAAA